MRITTISYGRKFNLGNYETEDIHLTAELESADKPEEALARLMKTAHEVYKAAKDIAAKAHATGEADRKEKAMTEADKDKIKKLFELDFPDAAKAIKNRTNDETGALAMYQAYRIGFERGRK